MIDDHRHRILQAAARVYTQHGWRGATTKRIAEEAGVNEVTLFRHFGSKEALLEQMIRDLAAAKADMRLPTHPPSQSASSRRGPSRTTRRRAASARSSGR